MRLRLAIALLLAVMLPPFAQANWIDPSWQYRVPIAINNSGSSLTDYQVLVNTTNLVYNNTGLVGSWHFSEASGTKFVDSSGNGNDGTYNGETFNTGTLTNFALNASSGWVSGMFGKALQFDGVDDFVDIPGSTGISYSTMTIGAWVYYRNNTQQERVIVGKHLSGSNNGYFLEAWYNQLGFYVSGNPTRIITTENFNGGWHYVAGVYDNGAMRLYVDGVLKASGTTSGIVANSQNVNIGRINNVAFWSGTIDDVRIYSRALSATEINQTYQNNTFIRSGLVGYWRLDDGSGTVTQDTHHLATEQNLNGTKFGNALTFDGANDYVSVPDRDDWTFAADFTVSAWVRYDSLNSVGFWRNCPVAQDAGGGSNNKWMLCYDPNSPTGTTFHIQNTAGTGPVLRGNAWAPVAGAWYLLTVTRQGTTYTFYRNGIADGSQSSSTAIPNANAPLTIAFAEGTPMNGAIDEVRIYNRALSAQEIATLYNASRLRPDYGDLRFAQSYTVYETPITISGTGTDLVDYQVLVSITNPTILSHMNSTGSDLRFFAAQTSMPYSQNGLPYWIESINSTQARVWVRANVSSAGSTVYMYYGNPAAQALSNGSATFAFFDDFSGGLGKWNQTRGASSVAGGELTMQDASTLVSRTAVSYPVVQKTRVKFVSDLGHIGMADSASFAGDIHTSTNGFSFYPHSAGTYVSSRKDGAYSEDLPGTYHDYGNYHAWEQAWNGTAYLLYRDGVLINTKTTNIPVVNLYPGLSTYRPSPQSRLVVDSILVRKYASVEPATAVGPESVKSTPEALLNYWLESDSRAWVKAASISAGQSTAYAYYGNPNASSLSNVYNTLEYFNDFDLPLDGNFSTRAGGWSSGTGELVNNQPGSSENGKLQLTTYAFSNMSFDFRINHVSGDYSFPVIRFDGTWGNDWWGNSYQAQIGGASTILYRHTSGSSVQVGSTGSGLPSGWHEMSLRAAGSTIQAYLDGNLVISGADTSYTSGRIGIMAHSPAGSVQYKYDKWRVRKYAYPEPALSLQQEQAYSAPVVSLGISPASKTTYPNYNETFALNVTNIQNFTDGFLLSCSGTCAYSENPVSLTANQTKTVNVTMTSANVSSTASYQIIAASVANASNYGSIYAYLTVDTATWRSTWNDAYGREFRYRIPLTITNGGNATLTDYQINATLDTASLISSNRMKSDCGDIRFTNGTNELPYFVDSACNSAGTKIWARVPYLPVGYSAVYLYYGSASVANASSGEATFDFFDDFDGTAVNSIKWNTAEASGAWTVGGGLLSITVPRVSDNRYILSQPAYKCKNCAIKTRLRATGSTARIMARVPAMNYCASWNWPEPGYLFSMTVGGGVSFERFASCGGATLASGTPTVSASTWYTLEGLLYESTVKIDFNEGAYVGSATDGSPNLNNERFGLHTGSPSGPSPTYDFDYFRVRKYVSPEPSVLAGATQTKGYRALVRRCGARQPGANVTAYASGNATASCTADPDGVCLLEVGAGTYDILFRFADNTTAWKNSTAIG